MPKRASKSDSASPRPLVLLVVMTLALFVGGELVIMARTDAGRLTAARYLHFGDAARVTQIVGRQIHHGLELAGVSADSIHIETSGTRPRWRVGLKADASPLQTNAALTQWLDHQGISVLSGREHASKDGALAVELVIGFPHHPTHEVVMVRKAASPGIATRPERLALVLYGFGDDLDHAADFFALRFPFAVAVIPGSDHADELVREARAGGREIVLHLPLEPQNYPQVDPGPGTILVSMKSTKIVGLLRHDLDALGPVVAVANHMGSLATQDVTAMSAVYGELKRRHLTFLHVAPTAGAICRALAADMGVAYEEPDAVLDAEARRSDPRALNARWNEMLKHARAHDHTIVMMRATPQVRRWLPGALAAKRLDGVSVVSLSELIEHSPAF
jgi:polysaccharide deacetylase 2 family uncharacterized protein YibQ